METVILIGFLIAGLLTSFSLIVFSEHFSPFVLGRKNINTKRKSDEFFRRIKSNFTRIKHATA